MYSKLLDTFIIVAEQGSFLKASQKLYITPASVMNQINRLEEQVGVKLIERTNHGTSLTAAGEAVYKDARKIINQSEQAIANAHRIVRQEQKVIRIGTSILRPCKMLVDLWSAIDDGTLSITIQIIPFDDSPANMAAMLDAPDKKIDCFVSPCDSVAWQEMYNIFLLKQGKCCVAVPRKHWLAKKSKLQWGDLRGETLMLVQRGKSGVLDSMRDEIEREHSEITIMDIPHFYDTEVFNQCEQLGCLMETLDVWQDVHPSLVTIPMEWDYEMPYGIVYAKQPSRLMRQFIDIIKEKQNDMDMQ